MKKPNSGKNTVKTIKKTYKRSKKFKKTALQAFILTGVLVFFSLLISISIILIRSYFIKDDSANNIPVHSVEQENTTNLTNIISVITETSPVVTTIPAALSTIKPPEQNLGNLVFVIDDAGNYLWELEPFLKIPHPLTIAVLPGLPYSAEAARRIRAAGKEVILHQPMEAIGAQDPGPGAIYSEMNTDEIRAILKKNLDEIGPVAGMNNHQGSKITMDREIMETILTFCAENNIYFLDSRTTVDSAVPVAAQYLGVKTAQRDVFIDNEQDGESMLKFITNGLERAQRNGSAVMIGHTWSPELAPLLTQMFPVLEKQGYTFKTALDIID